AMPSAAGTRIHPAGLERTSRRRIFTDVTRAGIFCPVRAATRQVLPPTASAATKSAPTGVTRTRGGGEAHARRQTPCVATATREGPDDQSWRSSALLGARSRR